jgi:hypothetical protein
MPNWQQIEAELLRVLTANSFYWPLLQNTSTPADVKREVHAMIDIAKGTDLPAFGEPVTVVEISQNEAEGAFYRGISARGSSAYGHWWLEEKVLRRWAHACTYLPRPAYQKKVLEFIEARMAIDKAWSYDGKKNTDGLVDVVKLKISSDGKFPAVVGAAHYQRYASNSHPKGSDHQNVLWMGGDKQTFVALTNLEKSGWVIPVSRLSPTWPFS